MVETAYQEQQYTVQRPVIETQYQTQRYTVQRPVVQTQYQTRQYTSMRPVQTMQTQTVDRGGYVAQQVVQPGRTSYSLGYARDAYGNNSGLIWTPQTTPATVQTQYSYRPNLVSQQVATTSYVPQTQQVQVPVQVQTMQSEVVSQQVPVQVQRMQTQVVTQKVPVQTTRMVATTQVRKVPYTVQRPITETITRKVPIQQQRWVSEERVRKVPVQTTRTVYETRKEPVEIQYYEQEAVTKTVMKPVTRQEYVPYTETVMVPKQVVQRVPLAYTDPFSAAVVSGYSTFADAGSSSSPSTETGSDFGGSILQPENAGNNSGTNDASGNNAPQTRMQKIEITEPESSTTANGEGTTEAGDSVIDEEIQPSDPESREEPSLNGNEDSSVKGVKAGWKIHWNPQLMRAA